MVKEKRASASKPKNGRHNRATTDAASIEPVLRMLSALTDQERAAVKHALDKAAWEEKILTRSEAVRQGNRITFTPEQLETFFALPTLDQKRSYAEKLRLRTKRAE